MDRFHPSTVHGDAASLDELPGTQHEQKPLLSITVTLIGVISVRDSGIFQWSRDAGWRWRRWGCDRRTFRKEVPRVP